MTTTASSHPVYLLPLTDQGAPNVPSEYNYIYLPPPSEPNYVVRVCIEGTSAICRQGSFWTNVPKQGEAFDRSKFREYKSVYPYTSPVARVSLPKANTTIVPG